MSTGKYTPTISGNQFDALATDLCGELRKKYEASKNDADRPPPVVATSGAFDHLPNLDSKTVASWTPSVMKFLGCRLDPKLIRKGGYASFEDFWQDIQPKLRASCPEFAAGTEEATAAAS